jgi:hypothetical protein
MKTRRINENERWELVRIGSIISGRNMDDMPSNAEHLQAFFTECMEYGLRSKYPQYSINKGIDGDGSVKFSLE